MPREYPLDIIASITSGEVGKARHELEDSCGYLAIPFSIERGEQQVYDDIKKAVEAQNRLLTMIIPAVTTLKDISDVEVHINGGALIKIVFELRASCSKFLSVIIERSLR